MNEMTKVEIGQDSGASDISFEAEARKKDGSQYQMNADEIGYMRGDKVPIPVSVPHTTSKYLNSALYIKALTNSALRRNGPDVSYTYDLPDISRGLADVTDIAEIERMIVQERELNPAFAAWLDRRAVLEFDPEKLAQYAPGTLGAAFHDFVVNSGMKMEFRHIFEPKSDYEYILRRFAQSHDPQHILTGFGSNYPGELALLMMNLTSAYRFLTPSFAAITHMAPTLASTILFMKPQLHYFEGVPLMFEAMRSGIEQGKNIKMPLFMVPWEDYLDWQIDDICADLGIVRGPAEVWDESEKLFYD